jgi:hypothetical protein
VPLNYLEQNKKVISVLVPNYNIPIVSKKLPNDPPHINGVHLIYVTLVVNFPHFTNV